MKDAAAYAAEQKKRRVIAVHRALALVYPDAAPLLAHRNPFELLVAVILSAQTTDRQVNTVTPALFAAFPDAAALAAADPREVEAIVRPTGYFRRKASHIVAAAALLVERYHGGVPSEFDQLLALPGVGRKTANVMVGRLYGKPAVVVDTHFGRVVRRLGLTEERNPEKVEAAIRLLVPQRIQTELSMRINLHGRYCCAARRPACFRCQVSELCPYEPKTRA